MQEEVENHWLATGLPALLACWEIWTTYVYFSGCRDGAVPSHHVPCASAQREEVPLGEIGSNMQAGLLLAGNQLNGDFLQTGTPVGFLNAVV